MTELNYETVQNKAEICGSSQPEWDEGPKLASWPKVCRPLN